MAANPQPSAEATAGFAKAVSVVGGIIDIFVDSQHVAQLAEAKKKAKILDVEGTVQAAIAQEKGDQDLAKLKQKGEQWRANLKARRQRNREEIAAQAVLALPNEVAAEKPQEDWIYQFFNCCEDIGNEEMQSLWGRLLAGEITQPGSYSIRTLNTVKLLDSSEAILFTKLCASLWTINNHGMVVAGRIRGRGQFTQNLGLAFPGEMEKVTPTIHDNKLIHLTNIGLIELSHLDSFIVHPMPGAESIPANYFEFSYELTHRVQAVLPVGTVLLTSVGMELVKVAGGAADIEYHEHVLSVWRSLGFEVKRTNG